MNNSYRRSDFDIESGTNLRKPRNKPKYSLSTPLKMLNSINSHIHFFYKLHPLLLLFLSLSFAFTILVLFSLYETKFKIITYLNSNDESYPFGGLNNLVMVAGHSVYVSSCGKFEDEESWFLEPYQKHKGQAASFVEHIRVGVEIAERDEKAMLLFSGGETRKDAGPRSEAVSYWSVADSEGWFGKQDKVRSRTLTEENARDSFENLLFSVCRFRELTGSYPQNITVVSYDFKEERFSHLHRSAIGFPEGRFFFFGTPAPPESREGAMQGEAMARAQFQLDPYGCSGSLFRKRLKRDPFHRSIPYPAGCPELKDLFSYCGPAPYPGTLPWGL